MWQMLLLGLQPCVSLFLSFEMNTVQEGPYSGLVSHSVHFSQHPCVLFPLFTILLSKSRYGQFYHLSSSLSKPPPPNRFFPSFPSNLFSSLPLLREHQHGNYSSHYIQNSSALILRPNGTDVLEHVKVSTR
jgi:hypothetical protein